MRDVVRIESKGSIWFFNEIDKTYIRMPKAEKPRNNPEWGNTPGPLQDFVPHPYVKYEILAEHWTDKGPRPAGLYITVPEQEGRAYAPMPDEYWMQRAAEEAP